MKESDMIRNVRIVVFAFDNGSLLAYAVLLTDQLGEAVS